MLYSRSVQPKIDNCLTKPSLFCNYVTLAPPMGAVHGYISWRRILDIDNPAEAALRPDVLVIEGGEVLIPGNIDFGASSPVKDP